jgi:hypothetical protein
LFVSLSNSTFSLTASIADPVSLSPGQPFTDSIGSINGMKFYRLQVQTPDGLPPKGGLTVALTATVNGAVDMYLQNNGSIAAKGMYQPGQ